MSSWPAACKEVAHDAILPEDRERMGWEPDDPRLPPFRYRWEHVRRVVANGLWLCERLGADGDIVLAACWLHDVKKREPQHARRGAEFAAHYLPETDFPGDKIPAVVHAIASHEGLWRAAEGWHADSGEPFRPAPPLQPLEAAILWDADKLSKVGPLALLHYIPYELATAEKEGRTVTTEQMHQRNGEWLHTIAPRILASFNTLPAQQIALHFHSAYEQFWATADDMLQM